MNQDPTKVYTYWQNWIKHNIKTGRLNSCTMSKVIPNHVVRVGQTVCISPKEKHACLQHPNDGLSCHTLPRQCFYYTVEGWDRENALGQTQGCSQPNKSAKSTVIVTPSPSQHTEDKHQQEESVEPNEDSYPASPNVDISIENLNRLILEIDPTFKPLQQPTQAYNPLQAISESNTGVAAKHELDTSGTLQLRRMAQRCSEASMLSISPGSDTSYIFGRSSSQSLSNNESDIPLTRSIGSPSSIESLTGCYVTPNCTGSSYPRATWSQKENSPLTHSYQNHSFSSVTNPPLLIPTVLINGLPEESETAIQLSGGYSSSFKDKMPKTNSSSFSGVNSLNNSYSDNSGSSTSSLNGYSKEAQTTMKFVMDTSKYWFKPSITRNQAIQMLMDELPGTFIMRDSTSYPGSFGLALKVFGNKAGEDAGNHFRHFLIESSPKGVHLKGEEEEPYFGSLSAFVYQHTIMPLALPCKLIIPSQAFLSDENPVLGSEAALRLIQKAAVCNLLYLHSVTMETLTGKAAIQKAVSSTFEQEMLPTPTIVNFKVTALGITLTDIQRKIFFRRHYPLATINFCDMDPENRKWQKFSKTSRIFGVVSKSPADSENICHLFAEYDAVHPASHVVDFIQKLLLDV